MHEFELSFIRNIGRNNFLVFPIIFRVKFIYTFSDAESSFFFNFSVCHFVRHEEDDLSSSIQFFLCCLRGRLISKKSNLRLVTTKSLFHAFSVKFFRF